METNNKAAKNLRISIREISSFFVSVSEFSRISIRFFSRISIRVNRLFFVSVSEFLRISIRVNRAKVLLFVAFPQNLICF